MPPPLDAAAAFGVGYRPMTEADMPFVAALYASTRAEEVASTGWPPATQQAFLDHQHRAQHDHYFKVYPHGEWLIVERAGAPIGRLYLADQGDELHLIDISLVADERGKGLGGAILDDLLADAAARGKAIELYVEKFNPARRLYLRLGFTLYDENGVYERMLWRAP
jgi:ribosomal protein S18 acetylase RimI-like enzyme